jgi:hypothetical protein
MFALLISTALAYPATANTTILHSSWPTPARAAKPNNPKKDDGLCEYIADYLPSFCSCEDKQYGGIAQCSVNVLDLDTIGVKLDIEPCGDPLTVSLEVTESDLGIDYPITGLTAGEDEDIPIPGLSWDLPVIGSAGANMAVKIDGNIEDVTLTIGVDACASVLGIKTCGADLTSELPIWLLNAEFDFSNLCQGMKGKTAKAAN